MASTKLIQIQPYAYRLHHQLFYFLLRQALAIARAGGRPRCSHRPYPGTRFQPPLLDQMLHYFVRRIGMDFQFRGQAAHRGKRLSGRQLAADERLLGRVNCLIEYGLAATKGQRE